jgi:hypothetical protein
MVTVRADMCICVCIRTAGSRQSQWCNAECVHGDNNQLVNGTRVCPVVPSIFKFTRKQVSNLMGCQILNEVVSVQLTVHADIGIAVDTHALYACELS